MGVRDLGGAELRTMGMGVPVRPMCLGPGKSLYGFNKCRRCGRWERLCASLPSPGARGDSSICSRQEVRRTGAKGKPEVGPQSQGSPQNYLSPSLPLSPPPSSPQKLQQMWEAPLGCRPGSASVEKGL